MCSVLNNVQEDHTFDVRDHTMLLDSYIHSFVDSHAWIAISFAGSDSYLLHYHLVVL